MAYQIYDITSFPVDEYPYYYCDANVWIAALKCYCFGSVDAYEEPYHIFIEAVVNLNEEQDSQVLKRIKHQPKIILTSLVLSEIVNSFMRNVAMIDKPLKKSSPRQSNLTTTCRLIFTTSAGAN